MEQYNVTGMSCAACSSRVEKAVSRVPGVTSCSVSLLTNSMGVEGTAGAGEIIKAVQDAGYGASLKGASGEQISASAAEEALEDHETPALKRRLIASVGFLLVLMYFSMGHMMWGWPLPAWFNDNHIAMGLVQLLLAGIIMVINQKFFVSGFKSLWHRAPNMDTLVALGSMASFLWSVYVLFAMTRAQVDGDSAAVMNYMMEFYFESAAMILTLITVGKMLEARSKGKTTDALKGLMKLAPKTAVVVRNGQEATVPIEQVRKGDVFVVRPGENIPVDGVVAEGEASVNQASMTGEPLGVLRSPGSSVYAGTVVEEGEIAIRPTGVGDGTRLRQIVRFIEDSEALKAGVQGKAERLADAVVPFSFLLAGLVWLVTRNPARAASVLLVDYSCALKLSTPLAVLAAMKEGVGRGVLVKGGRFLESLAAADAVVFDKTGTLTESRPRVAEVIPGEGYERDDILRTAACLEEHFPHPVARAVVRKAEQEGLHHQEEHTEVEYVVAHGIASRLHGKRVLFGSRHYIHHDEGVPVDAMREDIERLAREGRSILYLAVDGKLAGLIAIEDPLRPEAAPVIRKLLGRGIRVVMLTGDDERTAAAVAERLGISEYRSQVLPTDKAEVIRSLQAEGHTVAMLGDGINDSPALSAADVGVTLSDGADLAREVADVVLTECRLDGLVTAVDLSKAAMRRIRTDFGLIMTLNTVFLASGLAGFLQPGPSALLHNLTTVGVSLNAMRPMLKAGAEPQLEEVSA